MKRKKIISLLLFCVFLSILIGCKNEKDKSKENKNSCVITLVSDEKSKLIEELDNIKQTESLIVYVSNSYSKDTVETLNDLLKENGYDFTVQFRIIPMEIQISEDWIDVVLAMKENGIEADVLPFWLSDIKQAVKNELVESIDAIYSENERERLEKALSSRFWELTSVYGENYGIGNLYAPAPYGWAVNKSIMEKYGLTYETINKPIWELEDIFKMVAEGEANNSNFTVFSFVPGYMDYYIPVILPDPSLPIGFWTSTDTGEISVSNIFETNEMQSVISVLNKYDENGYLRVSGIQSEENNFFMQTDYNGFPIFRRDKCDTWTNHNGIDLVRANYYRHTDYDLIAEMQTIPTWSTNKAKTAELLTFLFTNKEAAELLMEKNELDEDCEERMYQRNLSNALITLKMAPYEDADKKNLNDNELKDVAVVNLIGFQFDDTNVRSQANAVRNIYQEHYGLEKLYMHRTCGNDDMSWQEYENLYIEKLKECGIDDVVKEMNHQIEEFLKNENKNM